MTSVNYATTSVLKSRKADSTIAHELFYRMKNGREENGVLPFLLCL